MHKREIQRKFNLELEIEAGCRVGFENVEYLQNESSSKISATLLSANTEHPTDSSSSPNLRKEITDLEVVRLQK